MKLEERRLGLLGTSVFELVWIAVFDLLSLGVLVGAGAGESFGVMDGRTLVPSRMLHKYSFFQE